MKRTPTSRLITLHVQVLRVSWKVATDKELHNVVNSGRVSTSKDSDWTFKVDVNGLKPDSKYYYQVGMSDAVTHK